MTCSFAFGRWISAGLLTLVIAVAPASAAHLDNPNLLVDPSLEGSLTFDGPPFVGLWEGFSGGAGAGAGFSPEMPRTGAQSLDLIIDNTPNNFAGAFQDAIIGPGQAGQPAWFSGWHKSTGDAGGSEYRIEWQDASGNGVAPNTQLIASPGTEFEEFIISAMIPAGAERARLVYAIQSFGGALNQRVFVDDLNFNFAPAAVIPEPMSAMLIAMAGLGLVGLRRRS